MTVTKTDSVGGDDFNVISYIFTHCVTGAILQCCWYASRQHPSVETSNFTPAFFSSLSLFHT